MATGGLGRIFNLVKIEDGIGWQGSRVGRLLAPCCNPLRIMKNQKGNVPKALRLERGSGRVFK